ncbi:MAG: HD domain-containing protein [Armatimonadota bacterium]
MSRLHSIRDMVNRMISGFDSELQPYAYNHLHGVAQASSLLALKRGLDAELAAVAGLMHDLYSYTTGLTKFHDQNGAEMIRPILRDTKLLSSTEQQCIISAVFHHCDKQNRHGAYEELLKDADVLGYYLNDPDSAVNLERTDRLNSLFAELQMSAQLPDYYDALPEPKPKKHKDLRKKLADIAETLASQGITGIPSDPHYQQICQYWTGENVMKEISGNWCAAFIYHCCYELGFILPMRHPLVSCRFACVGAWLEWAQLPENDYWQSSNSASQPERGDIVIFDQLLSKSVHDHIGVVLGSDAKSITVAEGNSAHNRSAVIQRERDQHVAGYIRMDDVCKYNSKGRCYDPSVLV